MGALIHLGTIDLPEGILLILDPGLARFWRHDGDPASPRGADPVQHDLEIVGEQAEEAGRAYDRGFDPLFLFDRTDPADAKEHFDAFAREHGFAAEASVLDERVPHTRRARHALKVGEGLGVSIYNGLWSVVADGFPEGAELVVRGALMPAGEFEGRFEYIEVSRAGAESVGEPSRVAGVMVDHGQLLFAGLGPMGEFKMWEPADGLADYVFWGPDAAELAEAVGAARLGDDQFGWRDLPMDDVGAVAQPLQQKVESEGLRVGLDYRPHCNLGKVNAMMRESADDTAEAVIGGARMVACGNRWGDGVFDVLRWVDADGVTSRVRVDLATPERLELMRKLGMRQLIAIVTTRVIDHDEPIRFGERLDPNNPRDSGWFFSSGTETEDDMAPEKMHLIPLGYVVQDYPALEEHLRRPVGTKLRATDDGFEVEES